ncbi:MAG: hypothetical protein M1393_01235 [Candidatus Thermoplasmatota archaeon]|nr:hypothetical protein [Candidatus Thermoplasmatota archaeon]
MENVRDSKEIQENYRGSGTAYYVKSTELQIKETSRKPYGNETGIRWEKSDNP